MSSKKPEHKANVVAVFDGGKDVHKIPYGRALVQSIGGLVLMREAARKSGDVLGEARAVAGLTRIEGQLTRLAGAVVQRSDAGRGGQIKQQRERERRGISTKSELVTAKVQELLDNGHERHTIASKAAHVVGCSERLARIALNKLAPKARH
jgi:hypothetical protein